MKSRLRPLVYLLVVLLWLIAMSLPVLAFSLAIRGQIEIGSDVRRNARLFLVQEEDFQGIGLQWTRPLGSRESCAKSSLKYFLWEGDSQGQNSDFCVCYAPGSDVPQSTGSCAFD